MSQVTVTISGSVHEVQEAMLGLAFLYGESVTVSESAKAEPLGAVERASKPAIKKAEVKKAEVAPATPVVTPAPQATPAAAVLGTKTSRQMTISEMIPAALKRVSKDKLVELLTTFGATKGSEIKPADEERFIAAITILTA